MDARTTTSFSPKAIKEITRNTRKMIVKKTCRFRINFKPCNQNTREYWKEPGRFFPCRYEARTQIHWRRRRVVYLRWWAPPGARWVVHHLCPTGHETMGTKSIWVRSSGSQGARRIRIMCATRHLQLWYTWKKQILRSRCLHSESELESRSLIGVLLGWIKRDFRFAATWSAQFRSWTGNPEEK